MYNETLRFTHVRSCSISTSSLMAWRSLSRAWIKVLRPWHTSLYILWVSPMMGRKETTTVLVSNRGELVPRRGPEVCPKPGTEKKSLNFFDKVLVASWVPCIFLEPQNGQPAVKGVNPPLNIQYHPTCFPGPWHAL